MHGIDVERPELADAATKVLFSTCPSHSPCSSASKLTFFSTTDVATLGLLGVVDEARMKVGREDLFLCSSWYSGILACPVSSFQRSDLCLRHLRKGSSVMFLHIA